MPGRRTAARRHLARRAVVAAAVVALGLVSATAVQSKTPPTLPAPATGKPFKIGVIEDRSGPSKSFSQETVKGLVAAVKGLNAGLLFNAKPLHGKGKAGIMGRPIELVRADSTGDPNLSLTLTRKLISQGVDAIIFTVSSGETLNDRTACAESQTVCIGPWQANPGIIQGDAGQWMFTMAPTFDQQADVLAQAIKATGCKNLVVAMDDTAVTALQISQTAPHLTANGITIGARVVIPSGSLDLSAQIQRIRQESPCAVLDIVNPANDNATFLRSYSAAGIKTQLYGLGGIVSSPEVWSLAGKAIDGLVAVDVISSGNPYAQQFRKYYAQVAGKDQPFLSVHIEGLSALTFLKFGIEKAKTSNGPKLKAALESMTNAPSAVGHYGYTQTWKPNDHNGATVRSMVMLQFKDHVPSVVWKTWQPV